MENPKPHWTKRVLCFTLGSVQDPQADIKPGHDELTFNTIPNQLTVLRMLFVPLVIWFLSWRTLTGDGIAVGVFILAAVTDYFDGYIARTQNLVTVYGKLLDPLADKFLVVSTIIMLQELDRISYVITILLVCRELGITALRALASAEGVIIAASNSGKWKTAIQMVALPLVMIYEPVFGLPIFKLGVVLLYFSIAVSLWSAKDYAVDFFKTLKEVRKRRTHLRAETKAYRAGTRAAKKAARKLLREQKRHARTRR